MYNKTIAGIAVFCIYLVLTLPIGFAQVTGSYINVDIKSPDGTKTLATAQLPSFDSLVDEKIEPIDENGQIFLKLDVRQKNPRYSIKKIYVWFCKDKLIDGCIDNEPKYDTQKELKEEKKPWSEAADRSDAVYPQHANILTLVQLDINGQDVWRGSFYTVERSGARLSNIQTKSADVDSLEVISKEDSLGTIIKDFIENSFVVPSLWIKEGNSLIFGKVQGKQTKNVHFFGFENQDSPQSFDPPGIASGNIISPSSKQVQMFFPEGSLANPVTVFSNVGAVCGNGIKEPQLGETSANCCNDIGCSQTGFVCSTSQQNPSKPGVCIDSGKMVLVSRGVEPTVFDGCSIGHDVKANIELVNAPVGAEVDSFIYRLGAEEKTTQVFNSVKNATENVTELSGITRTDINCNRVSGVNAQLYECEFRVQPFKDCVEGDREIKNNMIFATTTLPGSIVNELNVSLPDLTIRQTSESFQQITQDVGRRLNKIEERLNEGVHQAEKLIDQCTDLIKFAVDAAKVMAALSAVTTIVGVVQSIWPGGGSTSPKPTSDTAGSATPLSGGGSNQGGGLVSLQIGDITGAGKSAIFQAAGAFLDTIGILLDAALAVCDVASTLLDVYTKITESLISFVSFSACIRTNQALMAQGSFTGGDPDNPEASINAAMQYAQGFQQCNTHLQQASSSIKSLEGVSQSAKDRFSTNNLQGSKSVRFFLDEENVGQVPGTCSNRNVKVAVITTACDGDPIVTMHKTDTGGASSDINIFLGTISSETNAIENYFAQMKNTAQAQQGALQNNILISASNIANAASQIKARIQASGGYVNVMQYAITIESEASKLQTSLPPTFSEAIARNSLSNIRTNSQRIKDEVDATSQPRDVTADVYGQWASYVPANYIFGETGRYTFSFSCPGVGQKPLTVDYEADCNNLNRPVLSGVGQPGPTAKLKLQIVNFENERGVVANRQQNGNFILNTENIDVKVSNIDIVSASSGSASRVLDSCYVDLKQAGLGLSTARRGAQIFVGKITSAVSGSTTRPGLQLTGTAITQEIIPLQLDPSVNWGQQDIDVIYECVDLSGNQESVKSTVILDKSKTDQQIVGVIPTSSVSGGLPVTASAVVIPPTKVSVTLNSGGTFDSKGISSCDIIWSQQGNVRDTLSSSDLQGKSFVAKEHDYQTPGTYTISYLCLDKTNNQIVPLTSIGTYTIGQPSTTSGIANSPPTIQIASPQNNQAIKDGQQFDIVVRGADDNPNGQVIVEYDIVGGGTGNYGSTGQTVSVGANGEYEFILGQHYNILGNKVLKFRVTDSGNNRAEASITINITSVQASQANNNPPLVVIKTPQSGDIVKVGQQFRAEVIGSDDSVGGSVVSLEYDFGGPIQTGQATVATNGEFSHSLQIPAYSIPGQKNVSVTVTDAGGKISTDTKTITVVDFDVSSPVQNLAGVRNSDGSVTLTWNAFAGADNYIVHGAANVDPRVHQQWKSPTIQSSTTTYVVDANQINQQVKPWNFVVYAQGYGAQTQASNIASVQ